MKNYKILPHGISGITYDSFGNPLRIGFPKGEYSSYVYSTTGDNAELTFAGHSLGGAAASSMATGKTAITFNRASVSKLTELANDLGSTRNVKNYVTQSLDKSGKYVLEPLTRIQNTSIMGIPIMTTKGSTGYIKINRCLSMKDAHSIYTIINALKP